MKLIKITGASQRIQSNGIREWSACYECHKCGEEFAYVDNCKTEKEAREVSDVKFDKQQRRFCDRCGYRLTDREEIPEREYIAELNDTIDELMTTKERLIEGIKHLKEELQTLKNDRPSSMWSDWNERMDNAMKLAEELGFIKIVKTCDEYQGFLFEEANHGLL